MEGALEFFRPDHGREEVAQEGDREESDEDEHGVAFSPLDAAARGGVGDRRAEERDGEDEVDEVDHFALPVEGWVPIWGRAPGCNAGRARLTRFPRFSLRAVSRIASNVKQASTREAITDVLTSLSYSVPRRRITPRPADTWTHAGTTQRHSTPKRFFKGMWNRRKTLTGSWVAPGRTGSAGAWHRPSMCRRS